jgi:hypothetical protein
MKGIPMRAVRPTICWAASALSLLAWPALARTAEKAGKEGVLVESLGALTGVHLYQAHANLGILNDARAKGVYRDKVARQHLLTALNLIGLVDKQLAAVGKAAIPADDRKGFEAMRRLNGMLRRQAEALKAFWDSKDKKDLQRFLKLRAETSTRIADLLGIK